MMSDTIARRRRRGTLGELEYTLEQLREVDGHPKTVLRARRIHDRMREGFRLIAGGRELHRGHR